MDYFNAVESKFGIDHSDPNSQGEVTYNCPYCEEIRGKKDTKHKMYVNINTGLYYCFKCGSAGSVGTNDSTYTKNVSREFLLNIFQEDVDNSISNHKYLLPITRAQNHPDALSYLTSRGLSISDIEYYDIRLGSTLDGLYPNRVVVPNEVVGSFTDMLVARSIDPNCDKRWKYLNPVGSRKTNHVFNLHRIPNNSERIIVAEGVFSAIACGRDAVATYGKVMSDTQLQMIINKKPQSVYIIYDYDAQDLSKSTASRLSRYLKNVYYVPLYDDRDPSDLGHDQVVQLINTQSILMTNEYYRLI
jgi:hypothetical protein